MSRRVLITVVVLLVALGVILAVVLSPGRSPTTPSVPTLIPKPTSPDVQAPPSEPSGLPAAADQQDQSQTAAAPIQPLQNLRAEAPHGETDPDQPPQHLGSLDPRRHHMRVDFARRGAGIASISFSDFWESASARRQAARYFKDLTPDQPLDLDKLNLEHERYVLAAQQPFVWAGGSIDVPVLAAHSIVVNGGRVQLLLAKVWTQTGPGRFETHIVDEQGAPILRIVRHFQFGNDYDITLQQRLENLSTQPLEIQWMQYGPPELLEDRSGYIDRRRFDFGYLPRPKASPDFVTSGESALYHERTDVVKMYKKSVEAEAEERRLRAQGNDVEAKLSAERMLEYRRLWPNRASQKEGWGLSWFASTNRYFGLAVHPVLAANGAGPRSLADRVQEIRLDVSHPPGLPEVAFTFLLSPPIRIEPQQQRDVDLGLYAGPLDRRILRDPPYNWLAMHGLILYQMSGMCAFCTFQWLAQLLIVFLSFLHSITFDWGIAIIGLVIVVRALLHPLTKKSQISIQRFGKAMGAMKPEMDKIKEKYKNDSKKQQAESMKLMREHGVNPFQMLGCLPMVLQMPIWIALWAMLYLAFDIRQEPAFYGIFQWLNNWEFLGDLSSPDNFFILPGGGFKIPLVGWTVPSINLLPLLMGVVFFIQQKYMSPPPSPNMTPEQIQQQRIMKVMMVVLFPLFLYKAPSGLTLYIMTSSIIGILESRYIRKHIDQLDPKGGAGVVKLPGGAPPKKPKDRLGRMWAEKLEAARQKRIDAQQRTFKKRK